MSVLSDSESSSDSEYTKHIRPQAPGIPQVMVTGEGTIIALERTFIANADV